jgi:soluble lytic murein transglycosylase-like protein
MDLLRIGIPLLALVAPMSAHADGAVFSFVDAQGVLHLSNAPEDLQTRAASKPAELPGKPARDELARSAAREHAQRYDSVVIQSAERFGIEAALVHAIIAVESGYDSKAVSPRGARGLMQLMPETARRYGVADAFDPDSNVRGGTRYLADLMKLFDNDVRLALAAYNAGEGAVLRHGGRIPPYAETVGYVSRVVATYDKLRSRSM